MKHQTLQTVATAKTLTVAPATATPTAPANDGRLLKKTFAVRPALALRKAAA